MNLAINELRARNRRRRPSPAACIHVQPPARPRRPHGETARGPASRLRPRRPRSGAFRLPFGAHVVVGGVLRQGHRTLPTKPDPVKVAPERDSSHSPT